ncbi:Rib/alpha-like domain-containing protein [Streptococcus mitis]|uniref:Rib/alpha-like domain-containing protein n=1 Tax=Streptococcus mitis TaxID=28037 RepID=UPI0021B5C090|nr:Rib/alpha-like domain-containing protein [Streptococcus mitis]
MYSRMEKNHGQKVQRFSIRKYSFGAASVAVAAYMMFGGAATVQADAQVTPKTASDSQTVPDASNQADSTMPLASTETATPTAEQPSTPAPAATQPTAPTETPKAEEALAPASKADTSKLEAAIARLEAALEKAASTEKTASAIESAKAELASAKAVAANEAATKEEVAKATSAVNGNAFVLESMPKAKAEKKEEKENKNQDSRNGKAIPGQGESGFRDGAATANPIIPATEGPTNNNKLGSGNNPVDGVFESAKNQFGDIDFANATEKSKEVKKQWSRSTASQGGNTEILGSLTYNWKEKEITAAEANDNNALNGWKIESGEKVTAVKPEAPTNVSANRPAGFDPKPSKVYDLDGKVTQRDNENPAPGNPLGVNAANQNYANGVNYSGMVGTHNLPKGYYLELEKQGTKISKEYAVNGNSRVMLSAITGGAYGNAGTAGTGEKVKITVKDDKGNVIASIRDDRTIGEKFEESHVSEPAGDGGNGDGWAEYRAIYEIPKDVTKIKVEIEALNDGTAINNSYLKGTNSKVTDGYFVGAVNLAVGTGVEMTTNVKSNNKEEKFGEDNLYKSKQKGEFEFTVNSVGGTRLYGSAETEIEVPKGVELPNNITNPTGWVWFGDTPVAPDKIQWDPATRKLRLKYGTSKSNNGDVPYIGVGSNGGKNDGVRKFRLPFTTADDYKGTATFKVRTYLPNGMRDAEDNEVLNKGDIVHNGKEVDKDGKPIPKSIYYDVVNGVRNTDNPDYYYNKTIYIDTVKPKTPTVEAVHTDSVTGEKTDKKQPTELLISVPAEKDPNLTDEAREKQDIAANDKNNGTTRNADTEVDNIKKAIGGLTSMKVTLPNSKTPITLTKKEDGWYNGETKVEVRDGKLVVPVPAGTDLTEASDTTNPDKRIKVTVLDKAGNESEPAYGDVINNAPTVETKKKDIYVYKTPADKKLTADEVLKKSEATATDLEDDRDGVDSTKPTIAVSNDGGLDSTKPGDYTVRVQATDSEGKKSNIDTTTVHVLDLITVDPTVTADPTNPSTTAPVSPKDADTPVKPGDENYGKYPAGVTRDDLVKEVTRTVKFINVNDKDNPNAQPIDPETAPDREQKVTYKRTATVNPETGEVTYSDWTVYEGAEISDASAEDGKGKFNEVTSPVIENYLQVEPADKTIAEKEAPTPSKTGEVTNEVVKVLYKEIGSFTPEYPADKKPKDAPDTIKYPNNPNDPTKLGDFSKVVIPYVDGYVPKYNGVELTPVDPADPSKGYKVPDNFNPTDNFGKTPIQYAPGIQKATVNFVSVDAAGKETPLDEKFNITDLSGKAGTQIPEDKIQASLDVLKSMGYTVKENPFDQDPTFDSDSDKDQSFTIKLTPKVSTPTPVYVVEGDKPTAEKLKNAVTTEGNDKTVDETKIPETKGKVGDDTLTAPVTVTYGSGDNKREETVNVPVKVVQGYPQIVPVDPKTAPKAEDSIDPSDYPEGAKFTYEKEPDTSSTGDKEVKVIVTDKDGNELVKVPATVRVVGAYRQYVPVDTKPETVLAKDNIDPEEFPEGTTFEYKDKDNKPVDTKTTGDKDVVVVAKLNGEPIAEIPAKVTVVGPKTQYVVANPDNTQPTPADSLVDKDKYGFPDKATFEYKEKVDTTKPGGKDVTVVVKDADGDTIVEVPAKVKVVQGNPQIIPVDQGQPLAENSINKGDYPEGATFEYEKVDGKDPVNISEAGDNPVTVVVKDKDGNVLVKVPTTVRVVGAYRQYVPVNTDPTKVVPAENIVPTDFPEGTTFEYKTPVDTSKPGDKDVVVVAKLKNGETIAEIPAKVTVVEPKTQYVAVGNEPDVNKSVDPSVFPKEAEAKPEYKEKDISKTPGEKDVTVVVKDKDGDTIVEVPAKVKVVQGNPQIIPVDQGQPLAENSINKGDYPEGATFEYEKVDGKDPVNISEAGDYPVNVIVKDKDGNKLVTVPTTVRVVDAYRQYVPVDTDPKKVIPAENIVPTDFPDGTTFEYKTPVDTSTPGDKDVVVVAKLNGEPIAEIPAKVTVVGPKTQYVAANPENTQPDVNKSVDPSVFPKEAKAKVGYKEDVDTKTPGIKDVTVVVKDEDGDSIVEVPAKVIVVQGKEQEVTVNPDKAPEAKDNINPKDFPEGATFTFKEQPDTKTPGKKNVIVVVKDKDGNLLVEVPAVVNVVERKEEPQTPKETVTATPIVVEVGTPITKEDVKGHVKLPKDAEIIEVGEIPTTETPGVKPSVKVKVKLPTGEIVVVDVPVTVIPKRIPETNPYNGDGYNGGGNGGNNYRPTPTPQNVPSRPTAPDQPVTPTEPGQPATPNQTQPVAPAQADATVATDTTAKPATPKYVEGQKELPNTGTEDHASLAALGLLGVLSGFGLVARKKKED